jgi:hypothetical protein
VQVDVRINDLRHTHASIGVGAGLELPIVGKLLGHFEADPVRSASDLIASRIGTAMGETRGGMSASFLGHSDHTAQSF